MRAGAVEDIGQPVRSQAVLPLSKVSMRFLVRSLALALPDIEQRRAG